MTLKLIEGFDIDVGDRASIYEAVAGSFGTTTGRFGEGLSLQSNSGGNGPVFRTKNMGDHATWIIGLAFKPATMNAEQKVAAINNDTNEQVSLWVVPGSTSSKVKFRVKRGSTTLGTSANEFTTTFWAYVEVKVVLDTDGTNGSFSLKVNEAVEASGSGIDTTDHGSSVANKVHYTFLRDNGFYEVDDMYVCNGAGAKNNDFLGDQKVEGKLPNAEGNRNQWTPNSGSVHFNRVNEATLDGDSTYLFISSSSDGQVELWGFPDITHIVGDVKGVQIRWAARIDSSGNDKMRPIFRSGGGSEATGTEVTVTSVAGYEWFDQIYEDNPVIAGAWTVADFNAMQIGLESRP